MTRARALVILFPILAAVPASAMSDFEAVQLANALATVIAAAEPCGFAYDQAAIAAWITANVPPDRMDFAGLIQVGVMGAEFGLDGMSESAMTAHCAAVGQTARHYGFMK